LTEKNAIEIETLAKSILELSVNGNLTQQESIQVKEISSRLNKTSTLFHRAFLAGVAYHKRPETGRLAAILTISSVFVGLVGFPLSLVMDPTWKTRTLISLLAFQLLPLTVHALAKLEKKIIDEFNTSLKENIGLN
jgi:hypothetical protein